MREIEQLQLTQQADTAYQIMPTLRLRYSPRMFADKAISDQDLRRLFEAARWAASSYNIQPWRFIHAQKGTKAYKQMLDCLSEFNQKWVGNAPILLITVYKEETPEGKTNFHALHDLGLAMGNMTTQAQYMDIALHHMAGIDWEKLQQLLQVPEGYHVATAVAIGYYGGQIDNLPEDLREQEESPRTRMAQEEFVFQDRWPK